MLAFPRVALHLTKLQYRSYAKKSTLILNPAMKQVHQETLRHINPYANIKVKTDIYVKVCPADVHEYPDADVFIAELHGGHAKNAMAAMKVQVADDEKQVLVEVAKLAENSDFHCELHVPIRANLQIDSQDSVSVSNMYCERIVVSAKNQISTKDIRAEQITLSTTRGGKITCSGVLLGKSTTITTQAGAIWLDKVQGDKLSCRTNAGNINTKACYSESSRFETDTGSLDLQNVHKRTEVHINSKGDLKMTGVHGNIKVDSKGGSIDLQLSELEGENEITTGLGTGAEPATINISDRIEETTNVEIVALSPIELDSSLSHLGNCIGEDTAGHHLAHNVGDNKHSLRISAQTGVKLGKQSWADSMRSMLGAMDK